MSINADEGSGEKKRKHKTIMRMKANAGPMEHGKSYSLRERMMLEMY